ncbi:hypothetical protein ASG25_02990 [Rhizobium sp. Leaf384]|uniref:GumC family protein n=1 Tax=unclassified Rhizobium TaxID=2613769 RepID=UPI000713B05B|nr:MULTISPECIES: AAA family ATPase [unclassified Rhizobium]KQS80565.1 hypothetical protein ASG25_02990 [Rhizobium sp. Leaf384]KQS82208.1 hypothetical protein ASG58_22520 [Rhizobium sp. Leaf383]
MLELNQAITASRVKDIRAPADPGDMAFVASIISRQSRLIGVATLVGVLLGLAVFLLVPSSYKATAVVLIDFKRLAAVDENFSTGSGRIDSSAVLSQLELLTSESVGRRVVESERLDLDPEFGGDSDLLSSLREKIGLGHAKTELPSPLRQRKALEALQRAVVGERIDLSYTIAVTFKASTGERAARLANAIAQAYIDDQLDAKRVASEKASDWFTQRIADLSSEVNSAQMKVIQFRRLHNIVTSDGKYIDEQQIASLSEKLLQAQYTRSGAEAKASQLKTLIDSGETTGALSEEFANPVVVELRNTLIETSRRAEDLANRYGEGHKLVVDLRRKMADLQGALNDQFKRMYEAANTEAAISSTQVVTLQKELAQLSVDTNDSRDARAQLANLESSAEAVKTIRDTFMSRYVDGIQKQSFPMTEARVISTAEVPGSPSFPTPSKTLGAGLAMGFGAGVLMAIAREGFTRRIRFSRQVREATGKTFLGYLPTLPDDRLVPIGSAEQIGNLPSLYIETLRHIKINMDLERPGMSSVIAFVASTPGEGTTTTAANFAALCAKGGWPTLLVDLNFRNESLSRLLAGKLNGGIAEGLSRGADIADFIVETAERNLHVLPAAGESKTENPGDLLSSPAFTRLMTALSTQYRYIVIDTPALGVVADADALASVANAFVMVAEWNRTELHVVSSILQNNSPVRAKLIGTVLNKAHVKELIKLRELHPRAVN